LFEYGWLTREAEQKLYSHTVSSFSSTTISPFLSTTNLPFFTFLIVVTVIMRINILTLLPLLATSLYAVNAQMVEKRNLKCLMNTVDLASSSEWVEQVDMIKIGNGLFWTGTSVKNGISSVDFVAEFGAGLNFLALRKGEHIVKVKSNGKYQQFYIDGGDACSHYPSPLNGITLFKVFTKANV
jgi:hypothetical protein